MRHLFRSLLVAIFSVGAMQAHAQAAPVLTFTLETATTADRQAILPKLTWSTAPAAASCTGSGGTGWAGAKAAAGTVTLAQVTTSQTYSMVCNWPGATLAVVTWAPPTTNTDGSALTDLAGFRIYYGTSAAALTQTATVADKTATSWQSATLAPGTWFFAVRAFNALGLESDQSNLVSKTTAASSTDTRSLTLAIKYPNPPVVN
jgi:hypothetical protein